MPEAEAPASELQEGNGWNGSLIIATRLYPTNDGMRGFIQAPFFELLNKFYSEIIFTEKRESSQPSN